MTSATVLGGGGDIQIVDHEGTTLLSLDSADEITIAGVQEELGKCTITFNGVTKSINTAWKLVPGIYVATAKRQAIFATTTTDDPPFSSSLWEGSDNNNNNNNINTIRRLEKVVYGLKSRDSKAVSYADYYQEKLNEGRIHRWTVPLISNPEMYLPESLKNNNWKCLLETGPEKDVVKPCWKRLIDESSELFPGHSVGYEVGLLGTKIPDIAFFPSNVEKPRTSEYEAYGDCSWSGNSLSELGQGIQYGHRILDANPLRTHVYGFITNNSIVVLLKSTRSRERPCLVHWDITGALTFEQGMAMFFKLVREDSGYLQPPIVRNQHLTIKASLGQGRTCRAFLADYNGMNVVAKLYDCEETVNENVQQLDVANAAMQRGVMVAASAAAACRIPTVQGYEGKWLLMTPVGIPFTYNTIRQDHIRILVSSLKIVHKAGIIHRDVRFANIFHLTTDDSVLLNDWGSSIQSESLELVAGCPDQWAHPDIIGVTEAVPHPKHDLCSLISSFGELIAPGLSPIKRKVLLREAFHAAENCDYGQVVDNLVPLLTH
jgi:hypothetical protein